MRQSRIMELLVEASKLVEDASNELEAEPRLAEISEELLVACGTNFPSEEYSFLVLKLMVETLEACPEWLPRLFPAFAMSCGDPDEDGKVEVDWELVRQLPPLSLLP